MNAAFRERRDRRHAPASAAGRSAGDLPNEFFEGTDLSAALDVQLSPDVEDGRHGEARVVAHRHPLLGGDADAAPGDDRATRRSSPSRSPSSSGARTTLEAAGDLRERLPDLRRPRRPVGLHLLRDAGPPRRAAALVLSHVAGANRISVGTDYERTKVDNEDSYGAPARRPDDAHLVGLRRGPPLPRGRPARDHRGRPPRRERRLRRLHEPPRRRSRGTSPRP